MSRREGPVFGTRVGSVVEIHIAPETGGSPESRDAVDAVAGRGLEGDRYFRGEGLYNERDDLDPSDVTLIEAEALDAAAEDYGVEFESGSHRRNITTRGVALNHLVGERFRVGEVVCEGVRLCEPCDYLQRVTREGVLDALVHRGGLRTTVVEGGTLRAGDAVSPL